MKCLHNWPSGPCQGELIHIGADEPWNNAHWQCETCYSTYNLHNKLKPVNALSWYAFCASLQHSEVDDSNVESKTTALIEIMGEQDILSMPHHFKQDHPNVLRLLFDDVDEPLHVPLLGEWADGREYIPVVPMTITQGQLILDFVRANEHKKNFMVHCAAGISRSGAVAKFINEYFGGDDAYFYQSNPYTKPNSRILKILRDLSQQK